MRVIVDRYEGSIALVELPNQKTLRIPRELLDSEVLEGDVIDILVNAEETQARKGQTQSLIDKLLKESPPFQG